MTFDWRTDWKRPVLWGAAFGVAAVLTLFVSLTLMHWYTSRPKALNVEELKGISSTASQYFSFDESDKVSKFKGDGFDISFIVENKTDKDFTFQQNTIFYKREVKSQALEEIKLVLGHPYIIPAQCGGPGCSDSFRRFLSGSSVFGLAAGGSGGRWALTGSAMLPLSQCGLTGRVSLSHPDDGR